MKKYLVLALVAVVSIAAGGISVVHAQEEQAGQNEAPKPVEVTVDGINYCLLCELSEEDVADANATYAHLNALKVTVAVDSEGNLLDELEGKTLHYLPTKEAEALLAGEEHVGEVVTIVGEYYKDAAVIKVKSFDVEDFGWDDLPVGTQSNIQVL